MNLQELATAKGFAQEYLRSLGVRDGERCVEVPYFNADGTPHPRYRRRFDLAGKWAWNKSDEPTTVYGLHRPVPIDKGFVWVVEGESDCWALWQAHLPAIGIPGASNASRLHAEHVGDAKKVFVVQEPGEAGSAFPDRIAARLYGDGYTGEVFAVELPAKDPRELMLDDRERFVDRLREAARAARLITRVLPDALPATEAKTPEHVQPHSLEAEMAVLGAVIVDNSMLDAVTGIVRMSDFYSPANERVFSEILALTKAQAPVDLVTLGARLDAVGRLESVGGTEYLSRLIGAVPVTESAEHYARIVRDRADLRALVRAGNAITKLGYQGADDVAKAFAQADLAMRGAFEQNRKSSGPLNLSEALAANYEMVCDLQHGDRVVRVQKTPWGEFNKFVGGFSPGNLVVWAGGAKAGKSGAVLTLADYVSVHYGAVMYVSLELTLEEMVQRYVAMYSGVSVKRQLEGAVKDFDVDAMLTAQGVISNRPVFFYGRAQCQSIAEMRTEIRELRRQHHVVTFVLDGLNFLRDHEMQGRYDRTNKNERLDAAYRELLRFASDYEVVVHVVTHINRQGAKSETPVATDIRDGGNPEGHAHAVIIPHRPKALSDIPAEREEGDFVIAAIRTGSAGVVPMRFRCGRGVWLDKDAVRSWFELDEPRRIA